MTNPSQIKVHDLFHLYDKNHFLIIEKKGMMISGARIYTKLLKLG